ncbi:MAG: hypothetical protein AAGA75_04280, partial [Cyanobacteria bacterium P01_E01_bin.6]
FWCVLICDVLWCNYFILAEKNPVTEFFCIEITKTFNVCVVGGGFATTLNTLRSSSFHGHSIVGVLIWAIARCCAQHTQSRWIDIVME